MLTYLTNITGTVTDENLEFYRLQYALAGTGQWTTFYDSAVERGPFNSGDGVIDGLLGVFDPTLLQRDNYDLRVVAQDINGRTTIVQLGEPVSIEAQAVLGNFRLDFTDLSIPLAGIPIQIHRTYDTLNAQRSGDFGFGWQLSVSQPKLRESVRTTAAERSGIAAMFAANPFRDGTRVDLTNPAGRRVGFTFAPEPSRYGLALASTRSSTRMILSTVFTSGVDLPFSRRLSVSVRIPRAACQISLRQTGRLPPADDFAGQGRSSVGQRRVVAVGVGLGQLRQIAVLHRSHQSLQPLEFRPLHNHKRLARQGYRLNLVCHPSPLTPRKTRHGARSSPRPPFVPPPEIGRDNPGPDYGELSRFTPWLTLTHTQRWHAHRHSTGSGHVYQGRFKSFPVQEDKHFYTVCRYVERNALRAKLAPGAERWRWGSDCPKYGGGLYWPEYDTKTSEIRDMDGGRDYTRGEDANKVEQRRIIDDIVIWSRSSV